MTSENPLQHPHHPQTSWDIFCRVIDNHGDLGVCWRLSADLAQRGHAVRLWVDDVSALSWMAPQALRAQQGENTSFAPKGHAPASVQVMHWQDHTQASSPHEVVVEAFGCELPEHFQQLMANAPHTVWVNLEYLSAEDYVARQHGLPSPVMHGPAKGTTKRFFYPGFSSDTGGLLREPDLLQRQSAFDKVQWLQQWSFNKPLVADERLISLFCYEPEALKDLLQQLAQDPTPTRLLVTAGRAQHAVREVLPTVETTVSLTVEWLPYMNQTEFDHLLWACDMNFVRGEDSLVRALWAGKPWVWQIYPQDDLAHHAKLQALCDKLQMPADLQVFQRRWNQVTTTPLAPLTRAVLDAWGVWSRQTQQLLMQQTDLTKQLIEFTRQKR